MLHKCFTQPHWATVTSNGSPYVMGPLSVLSVCPVCCNVCGQTVGWIKMLRGTEVGPALSIGLYTIKYDSKIYLLRYI